MRQDALPPQLQYIRDVFVQEDPPLKTIHTALSQGEKAMQIGPEEGKILYMLAKLINARKIVEIGTLAGYSAVWLARALAEGGHLYTLEKDHHAVARIRHNLAACCVDHLVTLCEGDAHTMLPKLAKEAPFDMVFIDADKGGYGDYLDWAKQHLRRGGLMVADNTLLFDSVYQATCPEGVSSKSWHVMRHFNKHAASGYGFEAIMLPTTEGMVVARKM